MVAFVLRRLALSIPLALGAATLVFLLLEMRPGDPADAMIGPAPVPTEVRQRIERVYGLDRPAHERYFVWLGDLLVRGELGWSHSRSRPVAGLLREALPPTALLAGAALSIHLLCGIVFGVVSVAGGRRRTVRWLGHAALLLYALPSFWLGLMAILAFSYGLHWFPPSSMSSVGAADWTGWARFWDRLWHLALPAAVLGLSSAAGTARFVQAGMTDALAQGFVRAARARGAGPQRVLWRHALRNAALPVVTLIGLSLPALLSGALVVEVVFAWPGMGRLTYDAIRAGDLSVVLATTWIATLLVVLGNLAADVAMVWIDPRVRLGGGTR